ncbi:MAG: DNA primase [Pseudomonadota bacterium]|nr:DNA primase [Pseudomonadota bacterium]
MARIPDSFIDDLLARSDLVELIGTRVPLKRQGKEYAARCPFHDERSASFTVSPTKQFYHCFGCGAHGTAISFLMNYDRLEFLDAVEELAKQTGMEVPRDTIQRNARPDSQDLYSVLEDASRFYVSQLAGNAKARAYLDDRGVDAETRARFAIGYAPAGFSALRDAIGGDPKRMALLERGGMMSKKDDGGRPYDKFRDRVMFPILDRRGRTIAFGGRVLGPDDSPKYLNSPETELFHKGRELYGLWQVRQAHKAIPRLIVVEGYMDVVALSQHGIDTAVATLGTATTPDHAELLFRNAPDVYFCFDGDRAGRDAAWKAVESCVAKMRDGRQAFFQFLPDGEDPDSMVRKLGAEGFEANLAEALPLSSFLFREIERDTNVNTLDGKSRVWAVCKPLIALMPDGAFRDRMIEELHRRAGNPNKLQRAQLGTGQDLRSSLMNSYEAAGASVKGQPTKSTSKRTVVRGAISLLLQRPALALALQPPFRFAALRQPGITLLIDLLQLVYQRPDISTGSLIEHFNGRDEQAALQKLASHSLPGDEALWRAEFIDAIAQLDRQTAQQRIDELQAKWREIGTSSALSSGEHAELKELQVLVRR